MDCQNHKLLWEVIIGTDHDENASACCYEGSMTKCVFRDTTFITHVLLPRYNIRKVAIDYSPSKAEWPDIWLSYKGNTPVVTVTDEYLRQSRQEREKRLVHELVGHHVLGLEHGRIGLYDFNTAPSRDSYSKMIYRRLINGKKKKV